MVATVEGQVSGSAAEVYEAFFVPALFAEWAPRVADAAGIEDGQTVLDVASGTGVLAREAVSRVGRRGAVVGLDRNEGMLDIARRVSNDVDYRLGRAEALPFPDRSFDAVVSQFGLMFFEDRVAALREMRRVLRPGGTMAVAVWDSLDRTPGYAAMTALLRDLFGDGIADALRTPYCLGDPGTLRALLDEAGVVEARVTTLPGEARFPSIASWVHTDVKGWTLADLIDDAQYQTLRCAAERRLRDFVQPDSTVRFRHPAHIIVARGG